MTVKYYKRTIDANHGKQFVEVINGVIHRQWLVANQGHYTGPGNPELEGKPKTALHGLGFKKVSANERERLLATE